ncbi:MAG: transposase family protein [Cyclobacteriaceae bacterium]|nr:transposase family protein [Cyclobacteriaceae bacterium]
MKKRLSELKPFQRMPTERSHRDLKRDWKLRLRNAFKNPDPTFYKAEASLKPNASRQELEELASKRATFIELIKIVNEIEAASTDKRPYGYKNILHQIMAGFQFDKPKINPDKSGYDRFWNKVMKPIFACEGADRDNLISTIIRHPARKNNVKWNQQERQIIVNLLLANKSHPRDYTLKMLAPEIRQQCEKIGLKRPSDSYLKKLAHEENINFLTLGSRKSKDAERKAAIPMLKTYTEVMREWQADGTRGGLYYEGNKFLKFYYVMDVASGKILGIAFGEQEDWKIVHEAVKMAVGNTRQLPKKLLVDCGSGNKKFDELYGENLLRLGCKVEFGAPGYPQSRAKVEKGVDVFENYCNVIPGWIFGIKNRKRIDPDLLRKEMLGFRSVINDKKKKEIIPYTKRQVMKLITDRVPTYNKTKRNNGLSPDEIFDRNRPKENFLNEAEIAFLFWEKTKPVLRGPQVRLEYRHNKYTFDLPMGSGEELVGLMAKLYGKKVTVYFDVNEHDQLEETAYLIPNGDLQNLITLKQQIQIHREAELRTENEQKYYHKIMKLKREVADELKSKREKSVKETQEKFGDRALNLLHPLLTEKEVIDNAESQYIVDSVIQRYGISEEERSVAGKVRKLEEITTEDDVTEVETKKVHVGDRWDSVELLENATLEPAIISKPDDDENNDSWRWR